MKGLMRGLSLLVASVLIVLATVVGCVSPKTYGGTITGTVVGPDSQPTTASVYLLDYARDSGDIYVDESASLSNQVAASSIQVVDPAIDSERTARCGVGATLHGSERLSVIRDR